MKIKTKIYALLASGSLLVALVGSVMFVANRDITADRQAIKETEQLMRSAAELRLFGFETILFRDSRSADQWQRKIRSIHGELQALEIAQPAARVKLERIRKNIESANAIYADLQPRPALAANATPFSTAQEAAFAARSFAALTLVIQDVIDSAIDLNRASRLQSAQSWRTLHIAIALMLLAMLAQLVFMWRLTRGSILRPLTTIVGATQRVAAGDYTVRLNLPQGDEIGTLASAFNAMSRQVHQTNQAIRLEQDNLAITLHSIGDAVIATDAQGLITRMNPVAERLTGWPLADALGQPLAAVFHIISAETRLPSVNPVQLVMEHGQVLGLANHTALLARDGQEHQIADSASPIRTATGEIVGVVLVFSDVTEKYRVEAALRASEQHFEAMARAMSDVMYRMSADWSTMHPLDGSALVASKDTPLAGWAWLEQNIPAEEHARIRQAIGVAIAQKAFFSLEHRVLRPDGSIGWTASRAVPILDAQGNVREWFGAASDITARKRAEEEVVALEERMRMGQLFANIGTWEWNNQSGEVIWTERIAALFGYAEGQLATSYDNFLAAVHPDDRPLVVAAISACVERDIPYDIQHRVVWPDGTVRWLLERGAVVRDTQGKAVSMLGVVQDIDDRKRNEEQLREKNSEIERFTYMISHDLKSPLVTIRTFLTYLQQDMVKADAERVTQDINYIAVAADKMSRMLDELLEFSRLGRLPAQKVKLNWHEIVKEAEMLVAGAIAQNGVQVEIAEATVVLLADRTRLVHLWQNLIENAVKFSGTQSAPLIRIGVEGQGRGRVFYVCDNGIGIVPRYHEKIFGLFEKLDVSAPGSGLGLALVKRIVEQYGGNIHVDSIGAGSGTCFRFTLPEAHKA